MSVSIQIDELEVLSLAEGITRIGQDELKVYIEHCAIIILQYILSLHPRFSGTSASSHLRPDAGAHVEI